MELIGLIVVAGLLAFHRYLKHREYMELIKQGIQPQTLLQKWWRPVRRNRRWRVGLMLVTVGMAFLISLLPIMFTAPVFVSAPILSETPFGFLIALLILGGLVIMYSNGNGGEQPTQTMSEERDENDVPHHKQHLLEGSHDEDGVLFERTADKINVDKHVT